MLLPFGQTVEHHLEGLNDEPAHYKYIKHLAIHRSLPVLKHWVLEPDAFVRNEFEYHQAPLYYVAGTPLYWLFGERGGRTACRLINVAAGILGIWVIVSLLGLLGYPARPRFAAAIFAGFCFPHLYFSSVVSNDGFSWLFGALLTKNMLRYGLGEPSGKRGWTMVYTMTLYLAAGLLTKSSFIVFYPVLGAVFAYTYIVAKRRVHLLHGATVLAAATLLALPWYARNLILYHTITGIPAAPADAVFSLGVMGDFVKGTVKSFWFPMLHLKGGTAPFLYCCAGGSVILGVHAVAALWWFIKERKSGFAPAAALALLLAVNIAAAFWYYTQWKNPESRFLFPAFASIVFFMIIPSYQFFVRHAIERFFIPYTAVICFFPYPFLAWTP